MIRKFMKIKLTNSLFYTGNELIKLMMRTFIFLFYATLFSLTPKHALSQNDKIVIDADMVLSVDEVFKIIKAQTDYSFVYHEDLFKDFPEIELHKGVIRLNKLLSQSISVGDINIIFTANNTILIKEISSNSKNQQRLVSGKVTDQSSLPVPGVTVLIKGTNKGTATDMDGYFTITVQDPANVLVFSSLGFETKEITVGNQSTINISIKESLSPLDEVVVSARYYNTSQRKETGSVSKIDAKTIEKQPVNNPLAAMQGHIPGVNITQNSGLSGGNYSIRIRGTNFIDRGGFLNGTNNNPLYIVDGVPYDSESLENTFNMAADIIGFGGVSPLNTINPADIETIEVLKDADATAIYGSRGANGVILITTKKGRVGKTQVKASLSTTLSEVSSFVDLMNTQQYIEMRTEAIKNDGYTLETLPLFLSNGFPDLYEWDQERYTDWQKVLIGGTAYRYNAQLSFSGGNKQTQFLLSGGYISETTIFPGDSKYKKASVHANINHQSKDKRFKLNFSTSYGTDTNNLPGNDLTLQARVLPPNAPELYDEAGNINYWGDGSNSFIRNPLTFLESDYNAINRSLIANTVLSYHPIPSLEFKTSLGYTENRLESYLAQLHTRFSPNIIQGQSSKGSNISTNDGFHQSWIIEPQINWQQNWNDASLNVLAGATFQSNKNEQLRLYGSGFSSNALILNLGAADTKSIDLDSGSEFKFQSFFGRINFNWQDKYILNLTGRRDGSSKFGPGKQFGLFGAIGTAWLFSEESFIEDSKLLSFGKLRASYGITGSDNIPSYGFYDSYTVTGNYNGSGLQPTSLFNPDYAWGETTKQETALELGFLEDRIFLSAAWYNNRSSNQLIRASLPTTTGFSGIVVNWDTIVENTGLEIDLRTVNFQNNKFKWSTTFNISANRNKLVSFPGLEDSPFARSLVVGKPLGIKRYYKVLGVDPETGIWQFEDYNNDGEINSRGDAERLVDLQPKYFGGLGNTISYKDLQLDIFFQFTKKKSDSYVGQTFPAGTGMGNQPAYLLDRWQQSGDQNPIQRYYVWANPEAQSAADRYSSSTARIVDGSFIRLRNISLSYTVPKTFTKGLDFSIYLQGQNLFVISKYVGADPEVTNPNTLPPLRQFTLGLNLGF